MSIFGHDRASRSLRRAATAHSGTRNWIEIKGRPNTTLVQEPGADPSVVWNPTLIRTNAGRYYVQCEDPYDQASPPPRPPDALPTPHAAAATPPAACGQAMGAKYEWYGTAVAAAGTGVFGVCLVVFVVTRRYVEKMYAPSELRKLGEVAGGS